MLMVTEYYVFECLLHYRHYADNFIGIFVHIIPMSLNLIPNIPMLGLEKLSLQWTQLVSKLAK